MRAYITCPISHTKERLALLPEIKMVVESCGIEAFVFQEGGTPTEIFERDFSELKKCDLIIAEVSERSHGVGIEIGMSYPLGLKRILLIQRGQFVSKLAQGIPETTIVEYTDATDLKVKLKSILSGFII
jgi:nucleoside 2-deoxyribosyltransferase